MADAREMLQDEESSEMIEMAEDEIQRLERQLDRLTDHIKLLLVPKDPRDDRNVIIEIRAGAGGDEAGIFAADLYRLYTRYAENRRWKTELLSSNDTGVGGFKEVSLSDSRQRRLLAAQVRERGAPGPTGADHRIPGAHPHFDRHRRRDARG